MPNCARRFVVSDCGAIEALTAGHEFTPGPAEGAAAALGAGTDLACAHFDPLKDALARVSRLSAVQGGM